MRKTNKKGFTIVELVIVIAVIAILAAVLIPTYSSLVKKANRSADIQAVREMNTALAVNEVTKGKNVDQVYDALAEVGITAKDYIPLSDGHYFFWIQGENRVVYTDDQYNILFPENYKGDNVRTKFPGEHFSLGGLIKEEKVEVGTDGSATVTTAGQLYYLSKHSTDVNKITINAEEIDLGGAEIAFTVAENKTLEIVGLSNGTTLKGLVMIESRYTDPDIGKNYASGLVAEVKKGATLTLKNIVIDHATIGGLEIGGVGALVGRINNDTTVTIEECKVNNTTVNGKNKVGAMVGSVASCTLTVTDCEVNDTTVNCSEGESGIVIGNVYNGGTVSIDTDFDWVKNSKLNLVETERETKDVTSLTWYACELKKNDETKKVEWKKANPEVTRVYSGFQKIVRKFTKEGKPETEDGCDSYRVFTSDAFMTVQNATVGETKYQFNDEYTNGVFAKLDENTDICINALVGIFKGTSIVTGQ